MLFILGRRAKRWRLALSINSLAVVGPAVRQKDWVDPASRPGALADTAVEQVHYRLGLVVPEVPVAQSESSVH